MAIVSTDALEESRLWSLLLDMAAGRNVRCPGPADSGCSFWDLYAPIARGTAGSSFVIAQLGQSLDGRIATVTGHSRYINCPAAIHHLHRVRALVDAVIVGIGTVIADDPQLTVRETAGPNPARVVIDPHFRLPPDAKILTGDGVPIFAVQGGPGERRAPIVPIIVKPSGGGSLAPADIIAALSAHGLRRLLVEGGAGTVSAFLSAGVVDRFHLSVAPIIIGAGPVGCNLPPIAHLDDAIRPQTTIHHLGRDVLFNCLLGGKPK
jgi:diaminohydroxyphosphoribosylaminopyrimidine deaminase / 5-amino-6-(5-phosphoribosylamino)uracil reductase